MGKVLSVRCNDVELGVLERAAAGVGVSAAVFVKRAALRAGEEVVGRAVAAAPVRPRGCAGSGVASVPPADASGVVPGPSSLSAGSAPLEELVVVVARAPRFASAFAPRAEALRAIRAGRVRVAGVVVREERALVDPGGVVV